VHQELRDRFIKSKYICEDITEEKKEMRILLNMLDLDIIQ